MFTNNLGKMFRDIFVENGTHVGISYEKATD